MTINELKVNLQSSNIRRIKEALYYLFDFKTYTNELAIIVSNLITSSDRGIQSLAVDCLLYLPEEFKETVSETVAPLIKHNDIVIRNIASDILSHYSDICYDYLKPLFNDCSPEVRCFALDVWGNIGSSKNWEIVAEMLNDTDKNVVISSIITLGNIGITDAVPKLIEKYYADDDFKPFVLNALGKIGGIESHDFLMRRLNSEADLFQLYVCIEALGRLSEDPSFIDFLLARLPRESKQMRPYILKAIFNVGARVFNGKKFPDTIREIARESLKEDELDIRKAALVAMGKVYDLQDIDYLTLEMSRLDTETKDLIVQNVMLNSPPEVVPDFIEKISLQKDSGLIFSNLIPFYARDWEKYSENHKLSLMESVLNLIDELPQNVINDCCDLFDFKSHNLFLQTFGYVKNNSIFVSGDKLEQIALKYELL